MPRLHCLGTALAALGRRVKKSEGPVEMRQAVLEVRGRQRRSAACVTVQRSGPARPGTLSLSTEADKRTTQRSAWVTEELQNGNSRSLPSTRHSAGGSTEGLASRRRQPQALGSFNNAEQRG